MMRSKRKRRGRLIAIAIIVALFLAAGVLVEFFGGTGKIPTWSQLHSLLGLETGAPDEAVVAGGDCSVTFFDVGQGDAVLIAQNNEYCLIDAGTYDAKDALAANLQAAGVQTLKYMIMTHPHADHMGGIPTVLKTFAVETLLLPDLQAAGVTSGTLDSMFRYAKAQNTAVVYAETGMELPLGEGTLTVLSTGAATPQNAEITADEMVNDLSLCLRYAVSSFSFIDTGDAEQDEETTLVQQYAGSLKSTLLKAGHHGSSTSNTADFLAAVQPQVVAVSCGLNNDYGHPHPSVMNRFAAAGIPVYRTDLQGTVTAQWKDGTLQIITTEKENTDTDTALPPAV